MMAQSTGFLYCIFQYLLSIRCQFNTIRVKTSRTGRDAADYFAHPVRHHAKFTQNTACDAALLIHQTK
jgi:hypothetical protein